VNSASAGANKRTGGSMKQGSRSSKKCRKQDLKWVQQTKEKINKHFKNLSQKELLQNLKKAGYREDR
jgi:hypothetical protein